MYDVGGWPNFISCWCFWLLLKLFIQNFTSENNNARNAMLITTFTRWLLFARCESHTAGHWDGVDGTSPVSGAFPADRPTDWPLATSHGRYWCVTRRIDPGAECNRWSQVPIQRPIKDYFRGVCNKQCLSNCGWLWNHLPVKQPSILRSNSGSNVFHWYREMLFRCVYHQGTVCYWNQWRWHLGIQYWQSCEFLCSIYVTTYDRNSTGWTPKPIIVHKLHHTKSFLLRGLRIKRSYLSNILQFLEKVPENFDIWKQLMWFIWISKRRLIRFCIK